MSKTIQKQFIENLGVMSLSDFEKLSESNVLIVGLGGLGGNLVNNLVRLGLKKLTLVDFDVFDESNLNRQLFSNKLNVGKFKIDVVKKELLKINRDVAIKTFSRRIEDLGMNEISGYNYVIDAVDKPQTKIYIANLGKKLNIPVLHGSCAGWYGQVGWILPNSHLIEEIYSNETSGLEEKLKNPSFTPSVVSGVMCSEFLKMIQKANPVTNELMLIDLFNNMIIKTKDMD